MDIKVWKFISILNCGEILKIKYYSWKIKAPVGLLVHRIIPIIHKLLLRHYRSNNEEI